MPLFVIHFWDYSKRSWKSFEVECPQLSSVTEYAECITEKLADGYEKAMFRKCMEVHNDSDVCRPVAKYMRNAYYEKLLPIIETFLETLPIRKKASRIARITLNVNEDVWATLTRREIAVIRAGLEAEKGKPIRLGMSMRSLVAFDADSRKFDALRDMIALGIFLCRLYSISFIVYPTKRGFHLVSLDPLDKKRWELVYNTVSLMKQKGYFKAIDELHIVMSLARGYTTVSVTATRDVHYLIDCVKYGSEKPGAEKVIGCRLWFSPIAIYRDRVISLFALEVDAILPLLKNKLWREVRDRWVEFLKKMEQELGIKS